MNKIKCVVSENGTIIPINNIAIISGTKCTHTIWTNRDIEGTGGYELSDDQYNALLNELKFIGRKSND